MLRSLEIYNYRNLKHLTIEKLGRVNLLLGKNNTGKTSILEAASILVHEANPQWLYRILEARGEIGYSNLTDATGYLEMNYQAISSLFSDWKAGFLPEDGIRIQQTLTESYRDADVVLMRLVNYLDEIDEQGDRISRKLISDFDANAKLGLEVALPDVARIVSLDRRLGRSFSILNLNPNIQFVRTNEISRDVNGLLWDKITLTHKQDLTIDALKIIEPDLDLINFVSGSKREERRALVKLRRHNFPVFLSSMGDGINRILTIILAMVNCENGYFLLDEFENGLHYSVQEQLWKVVFTVAERLNIQVFATTHSHDCIEAFANVLSSEQHKKDFGYMIRLDNYDGNIEATLYNSDEIQATTRVHVDPR